MLFKFITHGIALYGDEASQLEQFKQMVCSGHNDIMALWFSSVLINMLCKRVYYRDRHGLFDDYVLPILCELLDRTNSSDTVLESSKFLSKMYLTNSRDERIYCINARNAIKVAKILKHTTEEGLCIPDVQVPPKESAAFMASFPHAKQTAEANGLHMVSTVSAVSGDMRRPFTVAE